MSPGSFPLSHIFLDVLSVHFLEILRSPKRHPLDDLVIHVHHERRRNGELAETVVDGIERLGHRSLFGGDRVEEFELRRGSWFESVDRHAKLRDRQELWLAVEYPLHSRVDVID